MTVSVDAVVYYRIWLPTIAVANVYDYGNATRLLTSTTLRNVLGTKTLTEILSERENISLAVRAILDEVTKVWGRYPCSLFDQVPAGYPCRTGYYCNTLRQLAGVKVERVEL